MAISLRYFKLLYIQSLVSAVFLLYAYTIWTKFFEQSFDRGLALFIRLLNKDLSVNFWLLSPQQIPQEPIAMIARTVFEPEHELFR